MIDIILSTITIFVLFFGSITDFKKREVPDWISHGFIWTALVTRLMYSFAYGDFSVILSGVLGFLIGFAASYLFYYLAQWGGGDAKIFMGLGAVFGATINFAVFFVLLLFIGAIYGILFSIYLAIKNKKEFAATFKNNFRKYKTLFAVCCILLLISLFSSRIFTDALIEFLAFGLGIILFIGTISFMFIKSVEESCLFQKIKSSQLTEGDWVAETIKLNGNLIISKKNTGITKEQIAKLKNYKQSILVKSGIPFIPAFLLTFVVQFLFGHFFTALFSSSF